MTIPVVDLSDFTGEDLKLKESFVQKLGKAYEDVGFVAVKNHGIPDSLIADLYKYVQQFFSLPSIKKEVMKYQVWPGKEDIPLLEKSTPKAVKLPT